MRNTDAADRAAGPRNLNGGVDRLLGADASEHGVDAESAGQCADARNGLDDADRFMAHALSGIAEFHRAIGPKIAAADAGAGDADKRVGRIDDNGVRDVLDPDVAGAVHTGAPTTKISIRTRDARCEPMRL